MIFKVNKHKEELYNTLLFLSRNIFFYKKIKLSDNFETRLYLMFMHFSIMLIIFKKKNLRFNQKIYDLFFNNIENNLRELGFGDVSVNQKMKEFNRILYDILLKIELQKADENKFKIQHNLIIKYFPELKNEKSAQYCDFESYYIAFYDFCFEIPVDNMLREAINFKY